jgi:cell filamentation protein
MKENKEIVDELSQSKYCYNGTKILINKRNIKNYEQLIEIENGLTTYKLSRIYLDQAPFKKTFDLEHYLNIHKYLFEDLYSFAGCIRDENIYKTNEPYKKGKTPFCEIPFILNNLKYTLAEMKQNVRKINDKDSLVSFLAKYYLDLNIIHPFREGNGRTLREFLREYVVVINKILKTNFELDYNISDDIKEKLIKASILDDYNEAILVFNKILKENTKERSNVK